MKVFISYAHEDKVEVGQLRTRLEAELGLNVFIAHDDIAPTHEWLAKILTELRICDVLIAFLTDDFKRSEWTGQEVGFALAREIKVIPINAGVIPCGFLSRYQELNYARGLSAVCENIKEILLDAPSLKAHMLDSLIKVYGESDTFNDAARKLKTLLEHKDELSIPQKNEIVRLAGTNTQISGSWSAKAKLKEFIDQYKDDLDNEIVQAYLRYIII